MASAEVKLTFRINVELVSDFITKMQEHGEQLADGYRCPSVSHEDMRCEGIDGHGGDRHFAGDFHWPIVEDAAESGHVDCKPGCQVPAPHHHWQSPTGQDWIIPGPAGTDCDHLSEWNTGRV